MYLMRLTGNIVFNNYMCIPFIEIYEKPIFTKSRTWGQWTGATVSRLQGLLSPIHLSKWLGKWLRKKVIMKLSIDGSLQSERQRIFVLVKWKYRIWLINISLFLLPLQELHSCQLLWSVLASTAKSYQSKSILRSH